MKFALFGVFALVLVASAYAKSGSVSVYNSGGYVAIFTVKYDLGGERKSESSGDFSLGVTKSIQIPDGAKNIFLEVEEYWIFGKKSTVFTKSFDKPGQHCYKIWGTTLIPYYDSISC